MVDTIENLKKLGLKENRKYLILVIWLLVNITIIQLPFVFPVQIFAINMNLLDLIGVITFLPFLAFLAFIFLYSLIAKKDVKEIASWKVLLTFFLTLPILIVIIPIMVGIFLFSIFSYIFFTSWFILYGAYLTSKRLDENLKKRVHSSFYRVIQFFGGSIFSIVLLVAYILGSQTIGVLIGVKFTQAVYDTLNYVVIFIGIIVVLFIVVGIVFMFKKIFNAWLGIFSLMVVIYTFYLLIKIFLAIRSTGGETTSIATQSVMLLLDLFILLYSISTLMGSQAELLSKNIGIKRIGVDSILIWLVFSKVAYEFIHNYPFQLFSAFAYIDFIDFLDEAVINLSKNIGVLFFFLILLVALGFYQIRKYNLNERKFKDKVDQEVKDLLSPVDFVEQVKEPLHAPDFIDEQDNGKLNSYEEEKPNSESTANDYSEDFTS
ncbi:MAG: hypothetical protein HWN80_10580 [Candidatus Lokiarchaeota archaeon]|nr:hypothetical protein [Candidatus Lokiarchaeota archaeon]